MPDDKKEEQRDKELTKTMLFLVDTTGTRELPTGGSNSGLRNNLLDLAEGLGGERKDDVKKNG